MPTDRTSTTTDLPGFNQQLIDQALAVVAAQGAAYGGAVGAHLRHVIEHYEALLQGLDSGVVDYDNRPRDRRLECQPALAATRLRALRQAVAQCTAEQHERPLQVLGLGGTAGGFAFRVASSVGRELAFVASHAVHHYALLAEPLRAQGLTLPAHFGQAPGTVAHDAALRRAAAEPRSFIATQEAPCPAPSLTA